MIIYLKLNYIKQLKNEIQQLQQIEPKTEKIDREMNWKTNRISSIEKTIETIYQQIQIEEKQGKYQNKIKRKNSLFFISKN